MLYDYDVYESATGRVVDFGVCTEDEKAGIKEEWPAEEGYEIDFRPFKEMPEMSAAEENRMQGLWQEQMH